MRLKQVLLSIAVSVALAPNGAASAEPPLTNDDLFKALEPRLAGPTADPFIRPPDDSILIGRRFRVTVPLAQSERASLTHLLGGWSYDSDAEALRIVVPLKRWRTQQLRAPGLPESDFVDGFLFKTESEQVGSRTAQNAYGATSEVRSYRGKFFGIAELSESARRTTFLPPDANLIVDLKLSSEEARVAVANATISIEGTVVAFAPGRAIACGTSQVEATLNIPVESVFGSCAISSAVTLVTVTSPARSQPLAVWPIQTPSQ